MIAEAKADPGIFEAMRKSIARRARNQKAPYNSIAAVEAARSLPVNSLRHVLITIEDETCWLHGEGWCLSRRDADRQ